MKRYRAFSRYCIHVHNEVEDPRCFNIRGFAFAVASRAIGENCESFCLCRLN